MIRNSILYHRLWYVRKRNSWKIRIIALLITFFLILTIIMTYAERIVVPYLAEISELKTKALITKLVGKVVSSELDNSIKYEDIIILDKDNDSHVTSIQTNIVKMNRLSAEISSKIQGELSTLQKDTLSIPIGVLSGNQLFESVGPDFYIKIQPYGNVETDFKSEFSSAGVNQTRHAIYIQVKINVGLIAPLMNKKIDFITNIPVAETIIVGNVPNIYTVN